LQNWKIKNKIDPIETVSSLCGVKGIDLNVVDKHKRTPLHWAAKRGINFFLTLTNSYISGATICSLYMIERGAMLEAEDYNNNTPLGLAILSKHLDYAIMLMQKKASVKHPIFKVVRLTPEQKAKNDKSLLEDEKKLPDLSTQKFIPQRDSSSDDGNSNEDSDENGNTLPVSERDLSPLSDSKSSGNSENGEDYNQTKRRNRKFASKAPKRRVEKIEESKKRQVNPPFFNHFDNFQRKFLILILLLCIPPLHLQCFTMLFNFPIRRYKIITRYP